MDCMVFFHGSERNFCRPKSKDYWLDPVLYPGMDTILKFLQECFKISKTKLLQIGLSITLSNIDEATHAGWRSSLISSDFSSVQDSDVTKPKNFVDSEVYLWCYKLIQNFEENKNLVCKHLDMEM